MIFIIIPFALFQKGNTFITENLENVNKDIYFINLHFEWKQSHLGKKTQWGDVP